MKRIPEWSEWEELIVTTQYDYLPATEISLLIPRRTPGAIKARAKTLGIAGNAKAYLSNGGRRSNKNRPGRRGEDIMRLAVSRPWGIR